MDWSDLGDPSFPVAPDEWGEALDTVRAHCGWHIAPTITKSATFDGTGTTALPLRSLHVTAVSLVLVDDEELPGAEWRLAQSGVLHRVGGYWPATPSSVKVTFTHGYGNLPRSIAAVVRSLTKQDAATAGRVTAGPFTVTAPESASAGAAGLDVYQMNALAPYVLPPLP